MGKTKPARRRDRKVGASSYGVKGKTPYKYTRDTPNAALMQQTPPRRGVIHAGAITPRTREQAT